MKTVKSEVVNHSRTGREEYLWQILSNNRSLYTILHFFMQLRWTKIVEKISNKNALIEKNQSFYKIRGPERNSREREGLKREESGGEAKERVREKERFINRDTSSH